MTSLWKEDFCVIIELTRETVALIALVICLFFILFQYIFLLSLSHKQDARKKRREEASNTINEYLESIIFAPTEFAKDSVIDALAGYVGEDKLKMGILSSRAVELLLSDDTDDRQKAALVKVLEKANPMQFYKKMLHNGNRYEKAYACRKVAFFYEEDEIPYIRKLAKSKNRILAYNAAMALSVFGDEESVADIICGFENNYHYSFRIIHELLDVYSGDISSLGRRILENCGDYIRATVIKKLADYKLDEFEDIYIKGLLSNNVNLKIACVQALGKIGKPEYEHQLITAAHDKNWVVRSTAVKQLKYNTDRTKEALVKATSDPEWWVRFNAAKTLVGIDTELKYVEKVLQGYDRYGADAVKYMLYRKYSLS